MSEDKNMTGVGGKRKVAKRPSGIELTAGGSQDPQCATAVAMQASNPAEQGTWRVAGTEPARAPAGAVEGSNRASGSWRLPGETSGYKESESPDIAILKELSSIRERYGNISASDALDIFLHEGGRGLFPFLPDVLSRRARAINTTPAQYSKEDIAKMSQDPAAHEKELRAVSSSLASSTRTYDLIVQTYQGLMKYCWYITPKDNGSYAMPLKERYRLANDLAKKMDPKGLGHEILGLCLLYGKVFFVPQVKVTESSGTVQTESCEPSPLTQSEPMTRSTTAAAEESNPQYVVNEYSDQGLVIENAFLQQLPEDYCRIIGRTTAPGKWLIAFNLSYFDLPGTHPEEYGDLFQPMIDAGMKGWVNLPPESVLTFEVNDCSAAAAPPMTGLMASMTQIPAYENAQFELVLNPLTSIMTGELETEDTKNRLSGGDPVRVSPATRRIFEALWYRMLEQNNTGGIGLFLAPAKNLKLQTVSDTVSSTEIASSAIGEQILKSGMSALIPTDTDPKVDVAEYSAAVHARYAMPIYQTFERYFNDLFDRLNLGMCFHMFGDIFTWEQELENAREGMEAGRAADRLRYDAMQGINLLEESACGALVEELAPESQKEEKTEA